MALQADGKIVAVGSSGRPSLGEDFALARYNPNGSLDTSFSGDGKQTTDFGGARRGDRGGDPGERQDRRGGRRRGGGSDCDFALARYNPNGTLDTTFSGDGKQTTDFGGFDEARGVAIQANGKIVAGRHRRRARRAPSFALARYNPNGSLDTSFSGDGKQTTDFGGERQTGWRSRATARSSRPGIRRLRQRLRLARYNPNGSLDASFSGDGKQTTDFGFGADDQATGVVLQGRRQDRRGRLRGRRGDRQ